jgi:hypothetical protein
MGRKSIRMLIFEKSDSCFGIFEGIFVVKDFLGGVGPVEFGAVARGSD